MKTLSLISALSFMGLCSTELLADNSCPKTLTREESRQIANGEMNDVNPVGDMKKVIPSRAVSKFYTNLILQGTEINKPKNGRVTCEYVFVGKVSGYFGKKYFVKVDFPIDLSGYPENIQRIMKFMWENEPTAEDQAAVQEALGNVRSNL